MRATPRAGLPCYSLLLSPSPPKAHSETENQTAHTSNESEHATRRLLKISLPGLNLLSLMFLINARAWPLRPAPKQALIAALYAGRSAAENRVSLVVVAAARVLPLVPPPGSPPTGDDGSSVAIAGAPAAPAGLLPVTAAFSCSTFPTISEAAAAAAPTAAAVVVDPSAASPPAPFKIVAGVSSSPPGRRCCRRRSNAAGPSAAVAKVADASGAATAATGAVANADDSSSPWR